MIRVLHEQLAISEMFIAFLLSRNIQIDADLVDQLFNSSERRLARLETARLKSYSGIISHHHGV